MDTATPTIGNGVPANSLLGCPAAANSEHRARRLAG